MEGRSVANGLDTTPCRRSSLARASTASMGPPTTQRSGALMRRARPDRTAGGEPLGGSGDREHPTRRAGVEELATGQDQRDRIVEVEHRPRRSGYELAEAMADQRRYRLGQPCAPLLGEGVAEAEPERMAQAGVELERRRRAAWRGLPSSRPSSSSAGRARSAAPREPGCDRGWRGSTSLRSRPTAPLRADPCLPREDQHRASPAPSA